MKILLNGALGKMGRVLATACDTSKNIIVAGVDINDGEAAFPLYKSFDEVVEIPDVIIDFSNHLSTKNVSSFSLKNHIPVVIATTGQTSEELEIINSLSKSVPVFLSSNMSIGIHILTKLCKNAVYYLNGNADIEVIEQHHNQKVDAPSGTAKTIVNEIQNALSYQTNLVYDRTHERKAREKNEIGISSIRCGSIVGEHEVLFGFGNELISIKHSAMNRGVFADGALKAAEFILDQENGLYSMDDLLKEV